MVSTPDKMGGPDISAPVGLSSTKTPSVLPSGMKADIIANCQKAIGGVRNAVGACILAGAALTPAGATAAPSQPASPDYVIDGSKSTSDLMADLIMRFSLDEETAKIISEISADNFKRIRSGEIGKDDNVLHVRAIDHKNLIRVFGNDLSLAPLKNFSEVTGGETAITLENYEKVITALYDTTDVHLWLRKFNKDEYTASELVRYRKLKGLHLRDVLANMKELVALKDGRAEKLFQTFNADIKTLTVMPSTETYRILFTTVVSKDYGEKVFAGSDEAKKAGTAANFITQMMTRALLTNKNLPEGGVNVLFGQTSQNAITQMMPTPLQIEEMKKNGGGISAILPQARTLAVNAMTKNYDMVMGPLASKGKIAQYNEQIAAGEARIVAGEAIIAKAKALDEDTANMKKDIAKMDKNMENVDKIGRVREDINKTLRGIMNTSSKTEQDKLIATFNNDMTQFLALRTEIQRNDSDKKMVNMIAAVDADIAIIRSHPKLKPFDKDLTPFFLAAK